MTVDQFKKQYPDKAHLEEDQLWNAMEDALLAGSGVAIEGDTGIFRWQKGDPDIELSPEDEIEYQKAKERNETDEWRILDYTRVFWKAFDKPEPRSEYPLESYKFIIFDVSGDNNPTTSTSL